MAQKRKRQNQRIDNPPRRNFLLKVWLGLGVIALAEVVWAVTSFLRPKAATSRKDNKAAFVMVGNVEAFQPNSVTAFPRGRFYLICLEDGGLLAVSRRCTHLGCTVPWVEAKKQFICPCHASVFDIRGAVIQSPAPRALDIFPVVIENRVIRVDTGTAIKRSEFIKDQVVYPTPA